MSCVWGGGVLSVLIEVEGLCNTPAVAVAVVDRACWAYS